MERELEYSETFTKTVFKQDVQYVIDAIKEAHTEKSGWEYGEPVITPVDERSVRIEIPLKKYKINERTR